MADEITIPIYHQIGFASSRESEGWNSDYKTFQEFLDKYQMELIDSSIDPTQVTECLQTTKVKQNIKVPLSGRIKSINLGKKFQIQDASEWELVKDRKIFCVTPIDKDRSDFYMIAVPERKNNSWIAIQQSYDYEWTIGRVNERFVGPYAVHPIDLSQFYLEKTVGPIAEFTRKSLLQARKTLTKYLFDNPMPPL